MTHEATSCMAYFSNFKRKTLIKTVQTFVYTNSRSNNNSMSLFSDGRFKRPAEGSPDEGGPNQRRFHRDFETVLLIDYREFQNGGNGQNKTRVERALRREGIPFQYRNLPAGDYVWIASDGAREYVQDALIERKTPTDLFRCITTASTGKYKALTRVEVQMRKMSYSGIENKTYLLEGDVVKHFEADTTEFKAVNTYMDREVPSNGLVAKRTLNLQETIRFLIHQHRCIVDNVNKNPPSSSSMTFESFKERVKNAMTDPHFLWNLELRSVNRIGEVAARNISSAFPSKAILQAAYCERGRDEVAKIISCLGSRAIGATAAMNVEQEFCPPDAPTRLALPRVAQGSSHIPSASHDDVGELFASKKKRYPSKLSTDGYPQETKQWIQCLQGLKLKRLGPEKTRCIIDEFPTEGSLRAAFRDDADSTESRIKSLQTTGGRTVGEQVAKQLFNAFGHLSSAARMPQASSTQDFAVVTPPDSRARGSHAREARISLGNLKDDAMYDSEATTTLDQNVTSDFDGDKKPSAVDHHIPTRTRTEETLNEIKTMSLEGQQLVNVDTGTVERLPASFYPASTAKRRYEWLNVDDNIAIAYDFIENIIDADPSITTLQVTRNIDAFLDENGVE